MFDFLTIWTLALAAAIVLALAAYLIPVAWYLYRTSVHLAELVDGLRAVRNNVAPLNDRLTGLAGGLVALRGELQSVDNRLGDAAEILNPQP